LTELGTARVLVFPSIWYETFGRSMIEAFATGTPVVASNVGSMQELVTDGKNGFHFRVGDAEDLAEKVMRCFADQDWYNRASQFARREYELSYSADTNYNQLMDIYTSVVEGSQHVSRGNKDG
jgi:glycosyltransferase involved in cell wall biosynthesis